MAEKNSQPVFRPRVRDGQKYIVDGHHRALAAKELGLTDVPIQQVQLPFKDYKTLRDVLLPDN